MVKLVTHVRDCGVGPAKSVMLTRPPRPHRHQHVVLRMESGTDFFFASELKAFRIHPSFRAEVDPESWRCSSFAWDTFPRRIRFGGTCRSFLPVNSSFCSAPDQVTSRARSGRLANGTALPSIGKAPASRTPQETASPTATVRRRAVANGGRCAIGRVLSGGVDSSVVVH